MCVTRGEAHCNTHKAYSSYGDEYQCHNLGPPFDNGFPDKALEAEHDAEDEEDQGKVGCHIKDLVKVEAHIESKERHGDKHDGIGADPGQPVCQLPWYFCLFHDFLLIIFSSHARTAA
jgi:hypothetical protein